MRHRLQAFLGSIGHGIRVLARSILGFVGLAELARFVVPLLVIVFAVAAVQSARDTLAVLESRPEVTRTTLAEVAAFEGDPRRSIWFQFDALVDANYHETAADAGTYWYLAHAPDDPETGIVVRSSLDDEHFRQRLVVATLAEDPDAIAAALDELGPLPPDLAVDETRLLEERSAAGDSEAAAEPSELDHAEPGAELTVSGRLVSPGTFAVCEAEAGCDGADASWLYLFADTDGGGALLLRSPHPPNATPMRLEGLFLRDAFDLSQVVKSEWFANLQAEVPTNRALAADQRPPITVPASWAPTVLFAVLALLLLASQLAGYPVFKPMRRPEPARTLEPGEGLPAGLTGRIHRDHRTIHLDRSPGTIERLSIEELALTMWRYGLLPRDQSRREAEERFVAESGGDGDRLVVHERDQSTLIVIDRDPASVRVDAGRLYRVGGSVPAVHFRQSPTDAYLETRSDEDRDRIGAEIAAEGARG